MSQSGSWSTQYLSGMTGSAKLNLGEVTVTGTVRSSNQVSVDSGDSTSFIDLTKSNNVLYGPWRSPSNLRRHDYSSTRRFCNGPCGKWRHFLDFYPRQTLTKGQRPESFCRVCHNFRNRQNAAYKRRLLVQADYYQYHKLPAQPFREYLERRVTALGISNVASAIGISHRRLRTMIDGKYYKRYKGEVKEYYINFVMLLTVDNWMTSLGDHPTEIYDLD